MQTNEMNRGVDECSSLPADERGQIQEKRSQPSNWPAHRTSQPDICPRIEIAFHRQEKDGRLMGPRHQLSAVGVLIPADSLEKCEVSGAKRDKIAATAMVWTQNKTVRSELRESQVNVLFAQFRAIPANHNDFVVTQSS